MSIHPTAVIHERAAIGEDCDIGPFCVIGENVKLGKGCTLHSHVVIDGHTEIGDENHFYPFSSIGLRTQDLKWKGGTAWTRIGDRNTIREYVTINSATGDGDATVIGDDNNFLAYTHIAHDCRIGNHVIMSNVGTLAGHVVVEDCAIIGGLAASVVGSLFAFAALRDRVIAAGGIHVEREFQIGPDSMLASAEEWDGGAAFQCRCTGAVLYAVAL